MKVYVEKIIVYLKTFLYIQKYVPMQSNELSLKSHLTLQECTHVMDFSLSSSVGCSQLYILVTWKLGHSTNTEQVDTKEINVCVCACDSRYRPTTNIEPWFVSLCGSICHGCANHPGADGTSYCLAIVSVPVYTEIIFIQCLDSVTLYCMQITL